MHVKFLVNKTLDMVCNEKYGSVYENLIQDHATDFRLGTTMPIACENLYSFYLASTGIPHKVSIISP